MSIFSSLRMQPPYRLAPLRNVMLQRTVTTVVPPLTNRSFGYTVGTFPSGYKAVSVVQYYPLVYNVVTAQKPAFGNQVTTSEKMGHATLVRMSPPRMVLPPEPAPAQKVRYHVYDPYATFIGSYRVVLDGGVRVVYLTPDQARLYETSHMLGLFPWAVLTWSQRKFIASFYKNRWAADLPPVVNTPLADQTGTVGTPVTPYAFPSTAFWDPDDHARTLTYTATQIAANGSDTALPTGITFNPTTRTFSGTPAAGQAGVKNIRVKATDPWGRSVTDVFTYTIAP